MKIGFIDFQGLWEGRETALSFSALSCRPAFPRPARLRVRPPVPPAAGGSIPGLAFVLPGSNVDVGCCRSRSSGRSWLGLGDRLIGVQIDLLVFDRAPQPLDEDVVRQRPLPSMLIWMPSSLARP